MTLEPRHSPIVPAYGTASLADLSSSILASLDPEAPPRAERPRPGPCPACVPADRGRARLGTAPGSSRRRAVPVRAGPQLQADHGGVPGHHRHQPRLAVYGESARPARDARLQGPGAGRGYASQRAALGLTGRSSRVAAAAHDLRAGRRGGDRGGPCGPGRVPRTGPDHRGDGAARNSGRPTAWVPWRRRARRPSRSTGAPS